MVTKSVAIETSKSITVSKMLLNLRLDTALNVSFFLLLLHWDGKMLQDMQHIIKTL